MMADWKRGSRWFGLSCIAVHMRILKLYFFFLNWVPDYEIFCIDFRILREPHSCFEVEAPFSKLPLEIRWLEILDCLVRT